MSPISRRTFLYLAALTAVTALIIPTGALTTADIDRGINGQVAPNEHGYIGVQADLPIELRYGRNGGGVKGSPVVANSSVTLFEIRNQIPGRPPITTLDITATPTETHGPPPFVLPQTLDHPDEIRDSSWHPVTGSVVCGANTDSVTPIKFQIHATGAKFDISFSHTITIVCVGPPANTTTTPPTTAAHGTTNGTDTTRQTTSTPTQTPTMSAS